MRPSGGVPLVKKHCMQFVLADYSADLAVGEERHQCDVFEG